MTTHAAKHAADAPMPFRRRNRCLFVGAALTWLITSMPLFAAIAHGQPWLDELIVAALASGCGICLTVCTFSLANVAAGNQSGGLIRDTLNCRRMIKTWSSGSAGWYFITGVWSGLILGAIVDTVIVHLMSG